MKPNKRSYFPIWLICILCAVGLAAGVFWFFCSTSEPTPDWEPQEQYLIVSWNFDANSIEQLLDAYCDYRADSLRNNKTSTAMGEDLLNGTVVVPSDKTAVKLSTLFSSEVIAEEERRQALIAEMEWRISRKIMECTWQNEIVLQQESDSLVYLKCNITTIYNYIPFSSSIGESSIDDSLSDEFTTQHTITLQKAADGYRLIADAYAEEPTGMHSSTYADTTRSSDQAVS